MFFSHKLPKTYVGYDEATDRINIKGAHGHIIPVKTEDFIRSQQCEELSRACQAQLYSSLIHHPKVNCDQALLGGYSFSINGTQSSLYTLKMIFILILTVCAFMFHDTKQWLGITMPGAGIMFPLSFLILDVITEVYGRAEARSTLLASSVLMIITGLVMSLLLLQPSALSDAQAIVFQTVLKPVTQFFISLGIAMILADFINIWLFASLRKRFSNQRLFIRSLVSSLIGRLLFSLCGALSLWGTQLFDPAVFAHVYPQIESALMLTAAYTLLIVPLVKLIRYLNQRSFSLNQTRWLKNKNKKQ